MVENQRLNRAAPALNLLRGLHERYTALSKAKAGLGQFIRWLDKNGGEVILTRDCRPSGILMTVDEFESWQETKNIVSEPELMREIRHGFRQVGSREPFIFGDTFGEPL